MLSCFYNISKERKFWKFWFWTNITENVDWIFHIDFITEALNAFIKQIAFIKFANKGGNNISNATKLILTKMHL